MEKHELLRSCRLKINLKQKTVAEHFKVSNALICMMEKGKIQITELWARRFGDFYEVPWKEFFNK